MSSETATKTSSRGHHPVWFNLIRSFVELGGGAFCIVQQFNTTRDSVFGLLQGGTQTPAHMTTQQLLAFLQGNAGKLNMIAFTVALITQIVFWWAALPQTKNGHTSRWKQGIALLLFALEILSDLQYASNTQTVVGGNITRIFFDGGYAWIGIFLFVICMSYGSTFVFLNGIRVLGNVLEGTPD